MDEIGEIMNEIDDVEKETELVKEFIKLIKDKQHEYPPSTVLTALVVTCGVVFTAITANKETIDILIDRFAQAIRNQISLADKN